MAEITSEEMQRAVQTLLQDENALYQDVWVGALGIDSDFIWAHNFKTVNSGPMGVDPNSINPMSITPSR